jgi:hypothetical protein
MGFVYEEEKLELTCQGVVYPFRQPSAYEQKNMAKKFRDADENTDAVDLYIEFFVSLGLPADVCGKMSLKGLLGLFEYAVGSKKN